MGSRNREIGDDGDTHGRDYPKRRTGGARWLDDKVGYSLPWLEGKERGAGEEKLRV